MDASLVTARGEVEEGCDVGIPSALFISNVDEYLKRYSTDVPTTIGKFQELHQVLE